MKKLVFFILIFFTCSSFAGEQCKNCKIKKIGCSNTHHKLQTCRVTFDKNHNNPNNCSHNDNEFIINLSQEGGKAMLSIALTALSTNKAVDAYGTGLCTLWSKDTPRETMNYLYILN